MIFATLPNTPVGTPKGISHLLIVGVFGILSLAGIIILAVLERAIPDVLAMSASGVLFYLVGANMASRGNPPG